MISSSQVNQRDLENRNYFDRWSRRYDHHRMSPWFQYTQNLAIGVLDLKADAKILDVGCGTGFAVLSLASLLCHGKACGIDISPGMIEKAQTATPEHLRGNVEFRQASSDHIPYPSAEFDHVLCTNSFHHYPDAARALAEMHRVLRPSGQLVIFENAPDLSWYTWTWDRILRIIEKGHVRYYSSSELGEMLLAAGFEHAKLCYLQNEFFKFGKLFASIQLWKSYKPERRA